MSRLVATREEGELGPERRPPPQIPPQGLDVDGSGGKLPRSARDWMVDVGFLLLAVAGGAFGFLWPAAMGAEVPVALQIADLALGSLACLAVFFRRRWPVGLALALLPVGLFSSASLGAQGVAMFTVAVHRRFRTVAIVGVLYTVMGMAYWALRMPKPGPFWLAVLAALAVNLVINSAILGWGMFVRARRQLVQSLRERASRAEAEQQLRVDQARHLERERIAREMHDVLAHRISLLSLHAGALEFRTDAPSEEVARAAAIIRQNAHQALQDLRRVIWVLRESPADDSPPPPQPTLADLGALIEDSHQAGVRVRLDNRLGDLDAVPAAVGRDGYRIVQEALTNVRKHAPGCAVELSVSGAYGSGLTIEVRNRMPLGGPLAVSIPGTGTGIVGLIERATLAGGRLEHGRTGDGDYRLWAWLPWTA
jgi:signal transduction histidine kinase